MESLFHSIASQTVMKHELFTCNCARRDNRKHCRYKFNKIAKTLLNNNIKSNQNIHFVLHDIRLRHLQFKCTIFSMSKNLFYALTYRYLWEKIIYIYELLNNGKYERRHVCVKSRTRWWSAQNWMREKSGFIPKRMCMTFRTMIFELWKWNERKFVFASVSKLNWKIQKTDMPQRVCLCTKR